MLSTDQAQYGMAITSFLASRRTACGGDSCGSNGLPLPAASICILGTAQKLCRLSHPRLSALLDCQRAQHERLVLVHQLGGQTSLKQPLPEGVSLLQIAEDCLEALNYLHNQGIIHATLEPGNVLINESNRVKLFNFGLGHLTNYGAYVAFPIFNPRFAAPEVLSVGPPIDEPDITDEDRLNEELDPADMLNQIPEEPKPRYDARSDIWSLGMVLTCQALELYDQPWPGLKVLQLVRKIITLREFQGDVLTRIAREHGKLEQLQKMNTTLKILLETCLKPGLEDRPSAQEALNLLKEEHLHPNDKLWLENGLGFPNMKLRCNNLRWPLPDQADEDEDPLKLLSLQETYYLWKLAGGDILSELRKHGLLVTMPPVLRLPKLILGEGHMEGIVKERSSLYDPIVIPLSLEQLRKCLSDVPLPDRYPCVLSEDCEELLMGENESNDETANLPLVIKEHDVRYQFKRIVLYRRLLQGYPYHRRRLWQEARLDTLPLYRAHIWAALLGIKHDVQAQYDSIDKESWTPTDRQIEVDIPRCHQYNPLLASPEGHRKFKRVLKAWVATNPQYVYWQGLDSLCAPFLYLNFNDEPLAFACLSTFIPKYLHGMFRQDNAAVIQEYLAKFSHMQAFHDPELFNHLDSIGFIPDLYAIPWILTMFAHVFPLQNIFHLWDKLLLGNSSFPLCIGMAILLQLRERLLMAEFNDCILLFSDLPVIDIERCVTDSIRLFCATPSSLTWRRYGNEEKPSDNTMPDALTLNSMALEDQKSEKVPRMSGEELKKLFDKDGESSDGSSCILVIDIRPQEEYRVGALDGSLHLPASSAFSSEGNLADATVLEKLRHGKKGKVVCIASNGSAHGQAEAAQFAARLLALNVKRLCILHNGIDIFKAVNGMLIVPNV